MPIFEVDRGRGGRPWMGFIAFALVLSDASVGRYSSMNREELRAQIQAAANRLTDELVEYFGEMLQSVVKDVTIGVGEAKPLHKATPPPAPRKAAAKKVEPKPEKKVTPVKAVEPKKVEKKPEPKKVGAKKTPPKKVEKKAAPKTSPLPPKSGRRSNRELDEAADLVFNFLKDQGRGMRIEEINKAIGTSTRELMRPIKKLLAAKRIQKQGERRSTTYFAG